MAHRVDLWRIPLERSSSRIRELERHLSRDERARADRLRLAVHRRRFIVGRGLLREILAGYTEAAPAELRFLQGAHGKPELVGSGAVRAPFFNLSHSDELGVIAVSREADVGVDVERVRTHIDVLAIAERFFSAPEAEALRSLPADDRPAGFLRAWTRKEACVKAYGMALAAGLRHFVAPLEVDAEGGELEGPDAMPLVVRPLELPGGYIGALAVRGSIGEISIHARPGP